MLQSAQWGIIFVLVYDVLSSVKAVYLGSIFQHSNPVLMLVYNFSLVALFFWMAMSRKQIGALPLGWKKSINNLIAINCTTTLAWMGFYFSLKYLEPSISTAIILAVGPFFSLLLSKILRPQSTEKLEKIAAFGLLICATFIIYFTWNGMSGVGHLSGEALIAGFATSILCGLGVVGNTFFSKRLNEQKWTPGQIMAQRFYLIIFIGLCMWPAGQSYFPGFSFFTQVILVAVAGLIVPLYVLQLGIKESEPITVALVLALAPSLTLVLEYFDHRLVISTTSILSIVAVLFFTFLGVIPKLRKNKKETPVRYYNASYLVSEQLSACEVPNTSVKVH